MLNKKSFYILLSSLAFGGYSWIIVNLLNYKKTDFSLSICTLKNISGIPCASCGTTRSILFFFRGEWLMALYYNPIGILIAIILCVLPFFLTYDIYTKKYNLYTKYKSINLTKKFWISTLTLFIFCWAWNIYKYFNHHDF